MYARELEQLRPERTGLNLDDGVSTIDFPFKFTAQNTRPNVKPIGVDTENTGTKSAKLCFAYWIHAAGHNAIMLSHRNTYFFLDG